MIVDVQCGNCFQRITELDFRLAAPGQKSRIVFAGIYQREHALGRLLNEYCFFDQSHAAATFLYPVEFAILMEHTAA